ncbi:hypothetical protein CPLU01_01935 [Colletotrichum plurivorum]|uniref:Uncharacterized protein n=1 Tax=Colletotrichum plurivorum TaxID=2175906 RepID=A0A8H6KWY1_9PEZI|nr:hypothetical protein CPLU01_01935 [Colletotrichum plurivorum]
MRNQMVILDAVIMDEHPQLLGALFSVWKCTRLIEDRGQTSRAFITNVRDQCRKALGAQHIISTIFVCLCEGEFDPDLFIDRLNVLASELFAKYLRVSEPTSEGDQRDVSSDHKRDRRDVSNDYDSAVSVSSERFRGDPNTREPLSPGINSSYHGQDGPFFGSGGFNNSNLHQISSSALPLRTRQDMYPQLQEPQQLLFDPQPVRSGHLPALDFVDPETEPQKREATPSVDDESLTESDLTASESSRDITVEGERRRIVDTVMSIFLQRLDYYLEELGCCDEEAMNVDSEMPEEVHTHQRGSGTGASSSALNGRKRVKLADGKGAIDHEDTTTREDEISRENESEEEEKDDQRRRKKLQQAEKTIRDLLACPYFKWDPRRYCQQKPCCGPGWTTVHRLKEDTWREYATREIVPLVKEQLKIALAKKLAEIPQNLADMILEIVHELKLPLSHGFQMRRGRARDDCEEDTPDEDASEDEVRIDPPNAVQHDREEETEDVESPEAGPANQPRDPGWEVPGPVEHYPIWDQQQEMNPLYQEYGVAELGQSWIFKMGGYQGDVGWEETLFQPEGNSGVCAEGQQGRTTGTDNRDGQ